MERSEEKEEEIYLKIFHYSWRRAAFSHFFWVSPIRKVYIDVGIVVRGENSFGISSAAQVWILYQLDEGLAKNKQIGKPNGPAAEYSVSRNQHWRKRTELNVTWNMKGWSRGLLVFVITSSSIRFRSYKVLGV